MNALTPLLKDHHEHTDSIVKGIMDTLTPLLKDHHERTDSIAKESS